jgi:hypothetical protein
MNRIKAYDRSTMITECLFALLLPSIFREIEIDMQEVILNFAHQKTRKLYWNIVESGVKHHNPNTNPRFYIKIPGGQDKIPPEKSHPDKKTLTKSAS